jgi:hypothetical protein
MSHPSESSCATSPHDPQGGPEADRVGSGALTPPLGVSYGPANAQSLEHFEILAQQTPFGLPAGPFHEVLNRFSTVGRSGAAHLGDAVMSLYWARQLGPAFLSVGTGIASGFDDAPSAPSVAGLQGPSFRCDR